MSAARDIKGPWLRLDRIPQVHREFDRNRDPLIARSLDDMAKTEKQRRESSSAGGYLIARKKQDKPAPALKPPRHSRGNADREGWLKAERDAVLARAVEPSPMQDDLPEHQPLKTQPEPSM